MTFTVTDKAPLRGGTHLHASLVLLDVVDMPTLEHPGQLWLLGGFRAECQGVCGL
jgi:hypothetical protein